MHQYYPGQRVIATDGAQYVLAFQMEGVWLGVPAGAGRSLPRPVEPRYPAWGGDDDRAGADQAGAFERGVGSGARSGHRARRR